MFVACAAKYAVKLDDRVDIERGELLALAAQGLAHLDEHLRCVDELHLAAALLGLAPVEHPDVGRNARVVEHIRREGHDRVEQIGLDDPPADLRLARPGLAGEQRRAVEHDGGAAAGALVVGINRAHLRDQVQQEEHRAVRDRRQTRAETALEAHLFVLLADLPLGGLPLDTEGRIGEAVVEDLAGVGVLGEGVAEDDGIH